MFKLIHVIKAILLFSVIVFFAPLLILPFFNHASADDYICGYHLENEGFWHYQSYIYNGWGGRYAATFTGSLFARNNFLYNHYYLPALFLLFINIASVFVLFFIVNKYILKSEQLKRNVVFVCLLFTALQFCSLAEPSTYFFWFSSAITYYLPVTLLQLEIALWLLLCHTISKPVKLISYLLIIMLTSFINGFNELFIIVQAFLLLVLFLNGSYKKLSKTFIVSLLAAFTVSALIVLLSPGSYIRMAGIAYKSWYIILASISFHTGEVIWSICKNPIAWLAGITIYFFANENQEKFSRLSLIQLFAKRRTLLPVLILSFLIVSISLAVVGLKGSILPDRYINAVNMVMIFCLLLFSFTEGVLAKKVFISPNFLYNKTLLATACVAGLLANNFVKDEYKSLIAAPLYHRIMNDRETTLKNNSGKPFVTIENYDAALNTILSKDYPHIPKTVYDLLKQKPSFIFFTDDLADDNSKQALCTFYKIGQINSK